MKDRRTIFRSQIMDKQPFQEPKLCFSLCEAFRCSQRALEYRYDKGKKIAWCNYVPGGDLCQGVNCNYSFCFKHKLRPDNKCGLYTKPKQNENLDEDYQEKENKWQKEIRFKNKVIKKLKTNF